MAEPTRSRRLLRRSDMSKFGVEAEVVCACSQRRPQDLVAPLMTTGQRQVPLSGSNSDDSFHVLGYTRRRRRQFGRSFEILRATTCATTRGSAYSAPSPRLQRQRLPRAEQPEPGQLADHGTAGPTRGSGPSGTAGRGVGGSPCTSSRATKAAKVSCTTSSASIMCATSFDDTCVVF